MKEGSYITIQSWMRSELNLSGNELMAYALVFGFSQDGDTEFKGSMTYISDWLGTSRQTAITTMKRLVEKGLVERKEEVISGVVFVHFKALHPVKKFDTPLSKNLTPPCKDSLHHNTNSENIGEKDSNIVPAPSSPTDEEGRETVPYNRIVEHWNGTCGKYLSSCTKVTDKRRKAMSACWKEFKEDVFKALDVASSSDFLMGKDGRWSGCGFDWVFIVGNMLKILEGRYSRNTQVPDRKKVAHAPEVYAETAVDEEGYTIL